jgi:NitT/TauT family transport system substrate-binding protein
MNRDSLAPTTSRKRLLQLAFAAVALPTSALAQTAKAPVKIRVGTQPAEFTADIIYAIKEGFMERAGLALDLQYLTNGNMTSNAIISGALDIGLNDTLGVAQAHVRGVDLVFLAPATAFATPWPTGFVTAADAGIRTAKDLNGKTLGTRGLQNAPNQMASAWVDNNGGDSKSIKWVEINSAVAMAAIQSKRIDGVLIGEPYFTQAKEAGMHIMLLDHNAPSNLWMVNGWAAMRPWADANTDTVKRFSAAILAANKWANTHEAETYPIVAEYTKIPLAAVAKMMPHPWLESFQPATAQAVIDTCAKYGSLSRSFPASELFYVPR